MEYGRAVPARVLIVVPTLGKRPIFLEETLNSIRAQSIPADVVIVGPPKDASIQLLAARFNATYIADPGSQAKAINAGVLAAMSGHEFVNWIGDDDLLTPNSLQDTTSALDTSASAVLAYGACDYVSENGNVFWTSRAGTWAESLLAWGPDLIPQPGMLIRAWAWHAVGGVNENLRFAFDLDLLLSLRAFGSFAFTKSTVSCFRWHPGSLTVSDRSLSLNESQEVKRRHLNPRARSCAWTWELPVRIATKFAAKRLSARAKRA